jgi:hypothetical protein
LVFFLVMLGSNVLVMARPILWQEHARLLARVEGLQGRLKPNSRVFHVRDEVAALSRDFPLRGERDALPLEGAAAPGLKDSARWREDLSKRIVAVWDAGGDVWFAHRLLADKPRPESNWVEGDDPHLSWRDLQAFFQALETDETVGGEDGFVRLVPSPANKDRLAGLRKGLP